MASNKEMTPWFPASKPPERVGVYQIKGQSYTYSKWDGKQWMLISASIGLAMTANRGSIGMYQSYPNPQYWRGFVNEQA